MDKKITIDLPPSINSIWKKGINGQIYKTAKGKAWQTEAALKFRCSLPKMEKVAVYVDFFFKTNARRDTDNMQKVIGDALVDSGVIEDDHWRILNEWHTKAYLDRHYPRAEIVVKERGIK